MKKIIISIVSLVAFFSCQKVLDLDTETKTPKLVVNALFSDQEGWQVDLSRSLSVLDNGDLSKVDNATSVAIYEGSSLVTNLIYDGEKYRVLGLSVPPTAGKEYRIEVSAPNYADVSASDFCPSQVPIIRVDTSSATGSFGDKEVTVSVTFNDPVNSKNYYGIEVDVLRYSRRYNTSTGNYDTSYNGEEQPYITSNNPIIDNSGSDTYARTLTLKDNLFDGQQQSVSFRYSTYPSFNPDEFTVKKIRLLSFTDASYRYIKSIATYRNADGNPFAEPVQVYTNIEGGFGIFGGQSIFEIEY